MDAPPSRQRGSRASRGAGLGPRKHARGAVALIAIALTATGCATLPDAMQPASGRGDAILGLFGISFAIGTILFLIVVGLLGWVLVHYRASVREAASDVAGNRRLEVTWTLATLAIVATLFVISVRTMRTVDATSGPNALQIQVVGHQWWWEFRYPGSGVVTADELHVPINTPIAITVTSDDVIHSFWVPRFGWKQDAIPGKPNTLSITLDRAGTFQGACTEFCGLEHAWMRLQVVAQSPQDFQAWLTAQEAPAAVPSGGPAARGEQLFTSLACASCHTVAGTRARGTAGPNLTHVGSRALIAGGVLDNTPANMTRWLTDPHAVKPGVLMPSLGLSAADAQALTAYLEGLK